MTTQITYYKLKQVKISGLNPRKHFDEDSLNELAESIKQVGILSPLICRTNTKTGAALLELVCGERRYRAAKIAGLEEVPVITRDLTDAEAIDLMITENLQRKDVTPFEEAEAFQGLVNQRGYDTKMLAARFGKPEAFIRMRLKLNDLIEDFRMLFDKDLIGVGHAQEICKLSQKVQKAVFEKHFNYKDSWWNTPTIKELKRWIEQDFTLKLSDAIFELHDLTLDRKAGACNGCPKNTSSDTLLFLDAPKTGICLDISCFNNKKVVQFNRELAHIQEQEPDIVLGYPGYIYEDEEKFVKNLIKSGTQAVELSCSGGFRKIEPPDKPDAPDSEGYEDGEIEEALKDYQDELEDYENKLKEYNETIASCKCAKGFMVAGHDKGRIVYYERIREDKGSSPASGKDMYARERMEELQAKDERNGELAFEKTYFAVKDIIKANGYIKKEDALTPTEETALYTLMLGRLDGDTENEIFGKVKGRNWIENKLKYPAAIKLTTGQKAKVARNFLKKELDNGTPVQMESEAKALISIAREFYPEDTAKVEIEQQGIYLRRKEGIEKKIAELETVK